MDISSYQQDVAALYYTSTITTICRKLKASAGDVEEKNVAKLLSRAASPATMSERNRLTC